MSDITVSFLGEDFLLPSNIGEYTRYLSYAEDIRDYLIPLIKKQKENKTYCGKLEDLDYFKTPMISVGEHLISLLEEDNIYDATIDYFVYNNKGFIELSNIFDEFIRKYADIVKKYLNEYERRAGAAYNSAVSGISGSGFSIITNDVIDAALYSWFEYDTVKEQTEKADQQYRASLNAISNYVDKQQEDEKQKLLSEFYYPRMKEVLENFSTEIMARYMIKLEQHGLFDCSIEKTYNLTASDELLKNLYFVSNKSNLLKEAFSHCPFNSSAYIEALKCGLADIPTLETAKYLHQGRRLIPTLEKYIRKNLNTTDSIEFSIKGLATLKGESIQETWEHFYAEDIELFCKKYSFLDKIISDQDMLVKWVQNVITCDAVEFCRMDKTEISSKIHFILSESPIDESQFSLFKRIGLFNSKSDIIRSSFSINETNVKYTLKLLEAIENLIKEQQKIIYRTNLSVEKAKEKYEEAQVAYDIKISNLKNTICELETEKSKTNIFAFSKKRELNEAIIAYRNEMVEFEKNSNVQQLKDDYQSLNNIMHSF